MLKTRYLFSAWPLTFTISHILSYYIIVFSKYSTFYKDQLITYRIMFTKYLKIFVPQLPKIIWGGFYEKKLNLFLVSIYILYNYSLLLRSIWFLWTLRTIFTEAFRLSWILISKVHKNSYWPIQKTVIVLLH
jgi:hypothetical protein